MRSLVGALLTVGEGRRPLSWPADLLRRTDRASEVTVAPAHGLALVGVDYPDDDQLAARATQTRALRRTFVPRQEVMAAFATAPVLDAERFRADADATTDQDPTSREW